MFLGFYDLSELMVVISGKLIGKLATNVTYSSRYILIANISVFIACGMRSYGINAQKAKAKPQDNEKTFHIFQATIRVDKLKCKYKTK